MLYLPPVTLIKVSREYFPAMLAAIQTYVLFIRLVELMRSELLGKTVIPGEVVRTIFVSVKLR